MLRVGAALYMGNEVEVLPGTADQVSYHTLAVRVLTGHGFSFGANWWPATAAEAPTAFWSFLYTIYLVAVYAIVGVEPIVARLIQAVAVGLLQPWLAFKLTLTVLEGRGQASRHTADRVALIAAAATSVYIYFVYYAGALMTEPFYIAAVLGTLTTAAATVETSGRPWSPRLAVFFSLSVTAAVLLRQLFLFFLPVLFLWILLYGRSATVRQRLVMLGLAVALLVVAIAPITAYNYSRFGRFVLLNTNAGSALFWANHPIHGTQFIAADEMGDTYQQLIPSNLKKLDEAALDAALLREGINFVLEDPGRFLLLSLSRIPAYFKFWPDADSSLISNLSRTGSFGIFLPFVLYGMIRSWLRLGPNKRVELRRPPDTMLLLYLFILVYSGLHIATWSLVRYRLPVDAVLMFFAAIALNEAISLPLRRRFSASFNYRGAAE
jgi:hypothetical protein